MHHDAFTHAIIDIKANGGTLAAASASHSLHHASAPLPGHILMSILDLGPCIFAPCSCTTELDTARACHKAFCIHANDHLAAYRNMWMSNTTLMALQAGSYTVTYSAADKAGNVGTATRTVIVVSPCLTPEHFCTTTCRSAFNVTMTCCVSLTGR